MKLADGFAAADALQMPTECREGFARIFAGIPAHTNPYETERQADQRWADEQRAAYLRAANGRHPIHALAEDAE
jgi:hypothetical protein